MAARTASTHKNVEITSLSTYLNTVDSVNMSNYTEISSDGLTEARDAGGGVRYPWIHSHLRPYL